MEVTTRREPWTMTKEEYIASPEGQELLEQAKVLGHSSDPGLLHNLSVYNAIREGKPVPQHVFDALEHKPAPEPWQKTWAQISEHGISPGQKQWHKKCVKDALDSGKPVPDEVLADYPSLKRRKLILAPRQYCLGAS